MTQAAGTVLVLIHCLGEAHVALAQESSVNISGASAPSELKRFEPFVGRYAAVVDWPDSNLNWEGTFEIGKTIKNWYIETNLIKETAGPHRHWRMLITWDRNQKKYRVWRFETTAPRPMIEGVVRFENDSEWYAEWQNWPMAGGRTVTYFSRVRLKSADDLEIITDTVDADGKKVNLGIVRCKRRK